MPVRCDTAIIGAGIVGAACARETVRLGMDVVVVDSSPPGLGATAAGMGHIVVMDDTEAQFALTHWSRRLWDAFVADLPARAEVDRCGTIWVAEDAEDMAAVEAKHTYYQERGVPTEVLGPDELAAAEPALRTGLAGGLLVPGDLVVYAPTCADAMVAEAVAHGAVVERAHVDSVAPGRVGLADGRTILAEHVVVAAGAGAAELIAPWFPQFRLQPRKGHLVITERSPGFCRHQLIELGYLKSAHSHTSSSVAFNVQPRLTGQVLLGSSRQYERDDARVEPDVVSRMIDRATAFVPGVADLSVLRTWAGFRPASTDQLPALGPVPGADGVWLAAGHEGLGITTSLASGRMIADMLVGRDSEIAREPYLPQRFATAP